VLLRYDLDGLSDKNHRDHEQNDGNCHEVLPLNVG